MIYDLIAPTESEIVSIFGEGVRNPSQVQRSHHTTRSFISSLTDLNILSVTGKKKKSNNTNKQKKKQTEMKKATTNQK